MPPGQVDIDVSVSTLQSNTEGIETPSAEILDVPELNESPTASADGFLNLTENRFAYQTLIGLGSAELGISSPHVFLYGPAGTGKSHLLRAATQELAAANPTWRTLILTAADFAARFTEAAETKAFRGFRKQFQHLELLIMEDLQAISGRPEPQRQLVTAWDDALAHQCRLVVSCRSGASEAGGLIPEIVNRCHGAVQAPLRLPALTSRRQLLEHWTKPLNLAPEVIPFIAEQFVVSARELQGLAIQLKSLAQTRKGVLDLDFVRQHLLGLHPRTAPSFSEIAKCVARQFQITLADLRSKSRQPGLVLPRQCAMYLMRQLTDASLKTIGEFFGGRDHTTVLHACQKLQSVLPEQADLRQDLAKIQNQLQISHVA
ncbi:MAG: Chromosomal replication initiator DnaA domain protein [Planctomycetaceae bacterium]|nr:Chromosomal replication initiator DnaA domain protein [Planctomycetaceae bacterium]